MWKGALLAKFGLGNQEVYMLLFNCSVMSDSLWHHGLQHVRLPCPSHLMSIELVIPSNQLILCCPLLLLPSVFPNIKIFSNESVLHIRWPKYWNFNFSISPSNEYSGLIFFRIDQFDLLVVQGTLKSLLQQHNSKALILRFTILLHWFKMRKVWFSVIR